MTPNDETVSTATAPSIHPTVWRSELDRLGAGTVLGPFTYVAGLVRTGRSCRIGPWASLGHDVVLEDAVVIGAGAAISGYSRIGAGAEVGANAVLIESIVIGAGAVVRPGAVVTGDVAPGTTVAGAPARVVEAPGPGDTVGGDQVAPAWVAAGAVVEPGARIAGGSVVHTGAVLGSGVSLGRGVHVGRSVLGDGAVLADGAVVAGHAVIGAGAYLGRGVRVGAGATVGDGVSVGDGVTVPPGAVVLADVAANADGPDTDPCEQRRARECELTDLVGAVDRFDGRGAWWVGAAAVSVRRTSSSVVLVGGGGNVASAHIYLRAVEQADGRHRWRVLGVVDDGEPDLERLARLGLPFLGPLDLVAGLGADAYLLGAGKPAVRRSLVERLPADVASLALIHPAALVDVDTTLGEGCLLQPRATVARGARLGAHVLLSVHTTVGAGSVLDPFVSVLPGAYVGAGVQLGAGVMIGSRAVVDDGVTVGACAVIAAGAVVRHDVEPGVTVVGNPARVVGRPSDPDRIRPGG